MKVSHLLQASYKPLRLSGSTRYLEAQATSQLSGPVSLLTAAALAPDPDTPRQAGVFQTRHRQDMRFIEVDPW